MTRATPANSEPLFVGIDLGTSGCRAIAIDAGGRVHGEARVNLAPPQRVNTDAGAGTGVEQDPALWWEAVVQVSHRLGERVPREAVTAIAVDGTSGTLLLADTDLRPLGPALMYNDGRTVAQARRIAEHAPAASAAHGTSGALAKLLWLLAGPRAPRARYALHQADWIAARMIGRGGVSDANNCLKLGWDPVAERWPEWLTQLGTDGALLPRVVAPGSLLGRLCPAAAAALGLSESVRVVAGTTDSTAAFVATGACAPGEAVTSLGSTLVLKVIAERPVFAPDYGVYSQPLPAAGPDSHARQTRLWLVGGGSNSGGAVLRRYFDDARLAELSAGLDPQTPTGLDYYPLPGPGERFPISDPTLAPRLSPRPADDRRFLQGLLEGIARIEHAGYRRLAELGAPYPSSVRSVGGGAANAAWTAIRARLLAVPMPAVVHGEAAYGSALLARAGAAAPIEADET
ncbi:MAG: FGGY-family carbohydrate kinase [Gammaproteobacteria bacterium]